MFSYFTAAFLVLFLPCTLGVYAVVPKSARWTILLLVSYAFFAMISGGLILFFVISTLSVYGAALSLSRLLKERNAALAEAAARGLTKKGIKSRCKVRMRMVLAAVILLNFGILATLKYLGFFGECARGLLSLLGLDATIVTPSIGVPIGISFYTLMAVSYCVDVYREKILADRHLGRVALFLSFFPQIMEGPICRYDQTASDLFAGRQLNRRGLYEGSLRVLIGLVKKLVIADRLNGFVKTVFDNYGNYDASVVLLGAVLYTVQLYFDFSGTMDVALGMGRMFNVTLPENFRQPFFSRTAGEFWQRWHITLGAWLRDYVYYPVSLSGFCKRLTKRARRVFGNRYGPVVASSLALLCVWVGNGLWHGSGSQYLFFGLYYFVLIVAGGLVDPVVASFARARGIDRNAPLYRGLQIARTLIIVVIGEMFFRANGLDAGLAMFFKLFGGFTFEAFLNGQILNMGMGVPDFAIVAVFTLVFLAISILKEHGRSPLSWAASRGPVGKWAIWVAVFCVFTVFGAYGYGYAPVDPMYAQF